ncbi:hypothetical protein BDK51DRAFT_43047 [Blyttiomyces helicus]|uniref:Uncharacterized protein n=1 Tax=Blyttiomyces helicus TaxID=388810 RepID=A0A4V1IRE8_9FUNG|nr:hypothetical protein BDK51DRAFT_43047 [Blyttiomyces helicus]|eukprot:RKO89807.1 hypothetical protein BDK51DRAFT_43047 [Blyttiomyces helicus]
MPQHIILFPFPALGHIFPNLALAVRLCKSLPDLQITLLVTPHNAQRAAVSAHLLSRLRIGIVEDGLPEGQGGTDNLPRLAGATEGPVMRQSFTTLVAEAAIPVTAIVSDVFLGWTGSVARDLGIPRFILYTPPAQVMNLMLSLGPAITSGYFDPSSVNHLSPIPLHGGLPPVERRDLPSHLHDPSAFMFTFFVRASAAIINNCDGILLNTFEAFEPSAIAAVRNNPNLPSTRIWSVGPVLDVESDTATVPADPHGCLPFLAIQPPRSTLLISFGSIAVLSPPQVAELARALLSSTIPFIWSLRGDGLPPGFEEATRGRGLVVPFCPQVDILAHPATSVFLSHCGWNACLEAVSAGVPILAMPCFAEQRMNAGFLVRDGYGVECERDADGMVEAERFTRLWGDTALIEKLRGRSVVAAEEARRAVLPRGSSAEGLALFVQSL